MKTAIEILIVLWFDRINAQQINQWASEYIENQNVTLDKEYFALLDSNLNDSENLLVELVKKIDSNFTQSSVLAEIYTAKYLLGKLKEYLDNQILPLSICNLIMDIEVAFLSASRGLPENIAYYPEWLGSLWNACDWCDESWTFENSPHLETEIQIQVEKIEEWLLKQKIDDRKQKRR